MVPTTRLSEMDKTHMMELDSMGERVDGGLSFHNDI